MQSPIKNALHSNQDAQAVAEHYLLFINSTFSLTVTQQEGGRLGRIGPKCHKK